MTDANQDGGMLILQESSTDASGSSLVVYSPIDLLTANVVMSGEDASGVPLLPSGFAILPDVRPGPGAGASSSSGGAGPELAEKAEVVRPRAFGVRGSMREDAVMVQRGSGWPELQQG